MSIQREQYEALVERVIAAHDRAAKRFQGFYYENRRHVIRDLSKRDDQIVWERDGSGVDYEPVHKEMVQEIRRLTFRAALAEVYCTLETITPEMLMIMGENGFAPKNWPDLLRAMPLRDPEARL